MYNQETTQKILTTKVINALNNDDSQQYRMLPLNFLFL